MLSYLWKNFSMDGCAKFEEMPSGVTEILHSQEYIRLLSGSVTDGES